MNKHALAALVVGALSAPAFALDIPLQNGGFELTPPTTGQFGFPLNWVVQSQGTTGPTSGVFGTGATYGSFVASEGGRYAAITADGTQPAFTTLAQSLPIALVNMPFMCFDFIYLTTDPTTTLHANLDHFNVTVAYFSDSLGNNQIGATQVFAVGGINVGSLSPVGAITNLPFNGATVNGSGTPNSFNRWIGLSVPLVNPTAPFAQFTFVIDNNLPGSSANGITAVLIDNVRINPEPGTMALFGLGAAGLGGIAWRRRRARLAAAAAK